MTQEQKTLCKYKSTHNIITLLHSAGGHQGSRKAHQAGKPHFCEGNLPVSVDYPSKKPVMQRFGALFVVSMKNVERTVELLVIWNAMTLI